MKKFLPIIIATVISGLIISGLFATGTLEVKNRKAEKKIIEKSPTIESLTYLQHIEKGDNFLKKGMTSLAANEYIAANKQDPENLEPFMKMGKLYYQTKDYARAQEVFQQILMRDTNNEEASLYLAQVYIMMRDPEKAGQILTSLPASQAKLYFTGLVGAYFGKYDEAKNALNEAIKANISEDTTVKAKKILSSFDEYALNQGSQEIFLKTILAKNFNQVGQYPLAIPLLYNVVKEKKDYRDAWILLGYAYLNIEDTKNAIAALEQAKNLDNHKPETLFFLGLSYHANNQKDLAIRYIEEAVAKGFEPKIQAQQKLAEIYLEESNYEKSAEKYENVIALNDTDIAYYIRPMWLYIEKLNQPEKALQLAKKAKDHHPDSAMAFNLTGWAELALDKIEPARESLAKALQMDGNLSAAYLNLGKLYEKTADTETAKKYYQIANKLGEGTSIGEAAGELYNRLIAISNQPAAVSNPPATAEKVAENSPKPLELQPGLLRADIFGSAEIEEKEKVPKFKLPETKLLPGTKLQPLESTP